MGRVKEDGRGKREVGGVWGCRGQGGGKGRVRGGGKGGWGSRGEKEGEVSDRGGGEGKS